MKAINIDDSGSVLIDTQKGFNVWMDVFEDEDGLTSDWNKYIFHLDNEKDMQIKTFQEDCNNFDEASSVAIQFYLNNNN